MGTFHSIDELIKTLDREKVLLSNNYIKKKNKLLMVTSSGLEAVKEQNRKTSSRERKAERSSS